MRKYLTLLIALASIAFGVCSSASAQLIIGSGIWGDAKPSGGGGYTGPGDVVSGWLAFWGLQSYNAAYATGSNSAADIHCGRLPSQGSRYFRAVRST